MKISPPNYTQSPNVFFDEIFKNLKEGELRLVLVLVRQTFGWHKSADRISLSQLAEKSGMERRSVCRSLAALIEKGLVCKHKFGINGKERCYYALVVEAAIKEEVDPNDGIESEEEMKLLSNISDQCPKDTPPVTLGHPPSDLKTPTKETSSKETIQKKQQQEPAAAVFSEKDPGKTKPLIYPILESVDIPIYDKEEITRDYDESDVIHGVTYALHPGIVIKTSLAATIKWACKIKPAVPVSKADTEASNKSYAQRYDNKKVGSSYVMVCNKYVEIVTGVASDQYCFGYHESGFMDKFKEALNKCKFTILE